MSDSQRTKLLYVHLLHVKPVTIQANLPTLDEVRALIGADFWINAPKN